MKKIIALLGAVALVGTLTQCATILHGSRQQVSISSNPTAANVFIDGQKVGRTPYVANLARKNTHLIRIEIFDHAPYEMTMVRKVDGWIAGNIIFGGLVGLIIDAATGSMYKLTPEQVSAELRAGGTVSVVNGQRDGLFVAVTLYPKPDWQKIGELPRKGR